MKEYTPKNTRLSHVIDSNTKVSQKKNVTQKMAWVISRELNLGMSGSSNSNSSSSRAQADGRARGSSHGSSDSSSIGGAVFSGFSLSPTILPTVGSDSSTARSSDSGSKRSTSGKALKSNPVNEVSKNEINTFNNTFNNGSKLIDLTATSDSTVWKRMRNLKFHHRHILFDKPYLLPLTQGESMTNNIGYGGVLYSESSLAGYERNNVITEDDKDDRKLIDVMNEDGLKNYGEYRLLTHNCQHWVNDVVGRYNEIKKDNPLKEANVEQTAPLVEPTQVNEEE